LRITNFLIAIIYGCLLMIKILVIDDDELVKNMISSVLRKNNFEVVSASNGVEGVNVAKKVEPNIVLTDMLMPDKEGVETIIEVKQALPEVKVIAMSGGGQEKNMTFLQMAKKVGADCVLQKPFKPSDLVSMIKEMV
tara:strand:- start:188 stop:598 length:411 start_codon:yes stop_codon:yes gene_type:complete